MTDKLKEALERLRSVYDGMTDEEHRKHFSTPGTPKLGNVGAMIGTEEELHELLGLGGDP